MDSQPTIGQVVSVNVGMPREVMWQGRYIRTAIFKRPVAGSVSIRKTNLDGDRQGDPSVHGGVDKAVYGYPSEHYPFWRPYAPDPEMHWGYLGENLTTAGLLEGELQIGDRLRFGTAELQVAQPRTPCFKLDIRFNRDDMVDRFVRADRPGIYFRVLVEGEVRAGDAIVLVERAGNSVSLVEAARVRNGLDRHPLLLARAAAAAALPPSWRERFQRLLERG